MNYLLPTPIPRLVIREALIIQPSAIENSGRNIRPGRPNQRWDCVVNCAKLFIRRVHFRSPRLAVFVAKCRVFESTLHLKYVTRQLSDYSLRLFRRRVDRAISNSLQTDEHVLAWLSHARLHASKINPKYVTHSGSRVPEAPSHCHPDRRSWRSWHSLRALDRARVRNLRPKLQWSSCAGSH
jgi:hypothetical protein